MPQDTASVVLFSPSNLLEAVKTGTRLMAGDDAQMPWMNMTIPSKAPIALGGAVEGAGLHYRLLIPTELVRDIVNLYMQAMSGPGGPAAAEEDSDTAEDF
jgi:hypothetical protein